MDISSVLIYLGIAFLLAFFVETMVEYTLGTPIDSIPALAKFKEYKWALRYIAGAVGVYLSYYWQIDLVAITANVIRDTIGGDLAWAVSPVGIVISGLTIGRGSNYLHEFLVKHLKKPEILPTK